MFVCPIEVCVSTTGYYTHFKFHLIYSRHKMAIKYWYDKNDKILSRDETVRI
jgi:hypothetical protein